MAKDEPAQPPDGGAASASPRDDLSASQPLFPGDAKTGDQPDHWIGDYRIIRRLGAGGMGVVYEAEQKAPHRRVALKLIRGGVLVDEHQVRMFQREIQALARLKHPSIATIYDSGVSAAGEHYYAMELITGVSLDEHLRTHPLAGPNSERRLIDRLRLFQDLCRATNYAHQCGVIHRDLKPSNVMVLNEEDAAAAPSGGSMSR